MLNCNDINCIKEIVKKIVEEEGIHKGDFKVSFVTLPFNTLSRLNGESVEINLIKYESFSVQTNQESELNSSFILIAVLYAFLQDIEKIKQIISKYYGENSVVYKLIEVIFQ